jgi:hypothetical protein
MLHRQFSWGEPFISQAKSNFLAIPKHAEVSRKGAKTKVSRLLANDLRISRSKNYFVNGIPQTSGNRRK